LNNDNGCLSACRIKYDDVHLRIVRVLGVLVLVLEQKHRTAENAEDDEDDYDFKACEYVIEFMALCAY